MKKSIKEDSNSSYNYILLGKKLTELGDSKEGLRNLKLGINNIVEIFDNDGDYNPIDFDDFINEKIRAVSVTRPNYEFLNELIKELSKKI